MKSKTIWLAVGLLVVVGVSAVAYSLLGGNNSSAGLISLQDDNTGHADAAQETPPPVSVVDEQGEIEAPTQPEEEHDYSAPNFVMYDESGNAVTLDELKGVPIVLNFWASWCPPCKQEMPHFDEVYLDMGDMVRFIMVDLVDGSQETQEKGRQHIEDEGYSFPVYYDLDQDAAITYGVASIPTTYFIDADGDLITGAMGMIDKATLLYGIELITSSEKQTQ